jgi:hypothetical protein
VLDLERYDIPEEPQLKLDSADAILLQVCNNIRPTQLTALLFLFICVHADTGSNCSGTPWLCQLTSDTVAAGRVMPGVSGSSCTCSRDSS